MKKFVLTIVSIVFTLSTTACVNPSMDDGFDKLNKSLAELEAAIAALNIPQMVEDLESMNATAANMLVEVESMQGVWDESIAMLAEINSRLDSMLADSESWATSEQMDELKDKVEEFNEGVETLVLAADYDYDGVINAIDQCPNTPLDKIGEVNSLGCATGETPDDGN